MSCPICHDTHWRSIVADGVEQVVRCDCWRGDLTKRLLADARIPPRFLRAELDTFEPDTDTQRAAWRRAAAFVEAFPVVEKGLLFYGPHGVGKTHLAVGILKACIRAKGARAFFFELRELLRLVRDTYNRSVEETEMDVLDPLLKAELLVLDDLGAERTSDWVQETLGLVVNTRYNARRPTIFTSNLIDIADASDPRSFTFQVGARTRSRLLEMCDWLEIPGFDRREVGPQATAEEIARSWKSAASTHAEASERGGKLPPKARGQVRAQLRQSRGDGELKWSGGKAGS
jgi:DNA replication protein DnaC